MTGSVFHAVAPVSAVCAAFRTQPSAYPPEATKPDVAPVCGSFTGTAGTEGNPLGSHICPQCGQFGALTQGLLRGQKQPHWGRKRR